jgi:hypothetical protein
MKNTPKNIRRKDLITMIQKLDDEVSELRKRLTLLTECCKPSCTKEIKTPPLDNDGVDEIQ